MDYRSRNDNDDDGRNTVDLTLKLGSSCQNNDNNNQSNVVRVASDHLSNFNFIDPYSNPHQQLGSHGIVMNGGGQAPTNAVNYGMVSNVNPNGSWQPQPMPNIFDSYMTPYHPLYNSNINNAGSSVGFPVMAYNQFPGFNFGEQTSGSSALLLPSLPRGRRRAESYNDPNKRCSNCSTNDTPMWRKGPLGLKTLCNACGIKYRKEAERRRAQEAERSSG